MLTVSHFFDTAGLAIQFFFFKREFEKKFFFDFLCIMRPKPPCPMCGDNLRVKTLGGGTRGMYRYMCEHLTCSSEWQQVAPHKQDQMAVPSIVMKKPGSSRKYRCGVCGAMKRGHTCSATEETTEEVTIQVDTSDTVFKVMTQPVPFQSYQVGASSIAQVIAQPFSSYTTHQPSESSS